MTPFRFLNMGLGRLQPRHDQRHRPGRRLELLMRYLLSEFESGWTVVYSPG